jgi:methyl-accepting chemotaxis protein
MQQLSALLRFFNIRTRMIGAIAMVLVLLILVGGVGMYGMQLVGEQTRQITDYTLLSARNETALATAMGNLRRYEKDLIINFEKADAVKSYRAKWNATLADVKTITARMSAGGADADNAQLRKMMPLLDDYARLAEPVFSQIESAAFNNASAPNKLMAPAKDKIYEAEKLLVELSAALNQESQAAQEKMESIRANVKVVFVVALIFSAIIVVPLTLLNMKSICDPINEAESLASAIANGKLNHIASPVQGQDEASKLLNSLQAMQKVLQKLVAEVRSSSDHIRTASVEIASGNQDLSTRTEQTASNLQQTASSMQQLTSTVRQSADAASTANQLATSATEVAVRGGNVVAEVVNTMGEINTSSRRIVDIIGVIDGIAFQTNILALNAAVEAARAGEQGRGFAVVASEVRSLAQRSAGAAKEIKNLIDASVDRVEAGTRLVQDAGSTMSEIVASVQRVTDIMGEITAAASEQSLGIGNVNESVVQLDQMTQQNAALVEESAAAAESLKDQALRLGQVVDQFEHASTQHRAVATATSPSMQADRLIAKVRTQTKAPQKPAGAMAGRSRPVATPRREAPAAPVSKVATTVPGDRDDSDWESF